MKKSGLEQPVNILFSGNGSKVLNLLDQSLDYESLSKISSLIFDNVYESKTSKIKIKQDKDPKEITCKGGLMAKDAPDVDVDKISKVLVGLKEESNGALPKYSDIDENILSSICDEVLHFNNLFCRLDEEYSFFRQFTINPKALEEAKNFFFDKTMVRENLEKGINQKIESLYEDTNIPIEESLFFYPLIGIIHQMALKFSAQEK